MGKEQSPEIKWLTKLKVYNKNKTKFVVWHPFAWIYIVVITLLLIAWFMFEPIITFLCHGIINKETWKYLLKDFFEYLELFTKISIWW